MIKTKFYRKTLTKFLSMNLAKPLTKLSWLKPWWKKLWSQFDANAIFFSKMSSWERMKLKGVSLTCWGKRTFSHNYWHVLRTSKYLSYKTFAGKRKMQCILKNPGFEVTPIVATKVLTTKQKHLLNFSEVKSLQRKIGIHSFRKHFQKVIMYADILYFI